MREKYIDRKVGIWFIFGHHAEDDNLVDINNGREDVFVGIPIEKARRAVEAQEDFREKLYRIFGDVT